MTPQLTYKCVKCGKSVEVSWNPLAAFDKLEMMPTIQLALERIGWVIGIQDLCPDCAKNGRE